MKRNDLRITPAAIGAALAGNLDNFLTAATPGGIEAQEAAGQVTFVQSATLPKECLYCTREQLEAMGIKFGSDADNLFVNVQLPAGWQKKATNHSMWSDLVDDKGRKRASIFYKAAFYDRSAHISLARRYGINGYIGVDKDGITTDDGKHTHYRVVTTDCDRPLHFLGTYERDAYASGRDLETQAEGWLNEHFPDWKNPLAYWD